jgi:threonine dehydrogenase-like Zn-dependent dehydrogenase
MGIVEEVGSGVTLLEKGDRIVMPFNVADGRCRNCEEGKTAFCTGVNPGFAGGAYGYVVSISVSKFSHCDRILSRTRMILFSCRSPTKPADY